ncbi:hypothetical protein B484DRAFT_453445 [Ochromonadaceae sp. CCMP2298]|nr:hypothetical protein B484DRAFT_453445 [Ochromonadaceae sp. CCMP2298]
MSLWDNMLTEERRRVASSLGMKVSDVEEQEALMAAMEASRGDTAPVSGPSAASSKAALQPLPEEPDNDYDDDDEALKMTSNGFLKLSSENATFSANSARDGVGEGEAEEETGQWHKLPRELVDRILCLLGCIDSLGYLAQASRSTFQPSERTFQHLCALTYPKQTARSTLSVRTWLTWRNMLVHRPRLRTNGFYTLRTMYSKGYCNDNFWEEKQLKSVELRYYRHMRFLDNGKVLYSLDILEPWDMLKLLAPGEAVPKRIFEGRYTFRRRELTVDIPMHYCSMRFILELLDGDDGYVGKHNMLKLLSHSSVDLHQLRRNQARLGRGQEVDDEAGRVHFPLPINSDLRFNRFWELSSRQKNTAE